MALCFLILSCQERKDVFEINGTVAGEGFEDEVVYLVPLEGATAGNVDSAYIKGGKFHFSGKIDSADIRIIRTRPILRLKLEELLVVVEPGEIRVGLDSASWTSGTVQNAALQEWKENKTGTDRMIYGLLDKLETGGDTAAIENEISGIKNRFSEYSFSFVKANRNGIAGRFVLRMTRSLFTEEQLRELGEPGEPE